MTLHLFLQFLAPLAGPVFVLYGLLAMATMPESGPVARILRSVLGTVALLVGLVATMQCARLALGLV